MPDLGDSCNDKLYRLRRKNLGLKLPEEISFQLCLPYREFIGAGRPPVLLLSG
jgi:hypothetical protein